jgi:hypothetical protein
MYSCLIGNNETKRVEHDVKTLDRSVDLLPASVKNIYDASQSMFKPCTFIPATTQKCGLSSEITQRPMIAWFKQTRKVILGSIISSDLPSNIQTHLSCAKSTTPYANALGNHLSPDLAVHHPLQSPL